MNRKIIKPQKSSNYLLIVIFFVILGGIFYYFNYFSPSSSSSSSLPTSFPSSSVIPFIYPQPVQTIQSSSSTSSSSPISSISTTLSSSTTFLNNEREEIKKKLKLLKFPLHKQSNVTSSVRGNLGPPEVVIGDNNNDWLKDRWQAAIGMSGDPIPGIHWLQLSLFESAYNITEMTIDFETAYSDNFMIEIFCQNINSWKIIHQQSNDLLNQQQQRQFQQYQQQQKRPVQQKMRPKLNPKKGVDPHRLNSKVKGMRRERSSISRRLNNQLQNKVEIERTEQHILYKITINSNYKNPCLSIDDENKVFTQGEEKEEINKYISDIKVTFQKLATRWGISVWKLYVWGYK